MKICPNCQAENRLNAKSCAKCAASLPSPLPSSRADRVAHQPTKPLLRPSTSDPALALQAGDIHASTQPLPIADVEMPQPRRPQQSAATDKTMPLPNLRTDFATLPVGALLHDDRYEIQDIRSKGRRVNVYLIQDSQPVRCCPNPDCGSLKAAPGATNCPQCGIELGQVQPIHLTYLLREAADPAKFDVEGQLLQLGLDHPGVLLPQDHFTATPYADSQRAYLVAPEFGAFLAASLPLPQELPQVLDWGLQLAQALVYLHQHRISLRQINLNRIAIESDGQVARWTNLAGAEIVSAADQATTLQYFVQDTYLLAQTLFQLVTGQAKYTPAVSLPGLVMSLFTQALIPQQQPFSSAQAFAQALEQTLAQVRRPDSIDLIVGRRSDVGQARKLNEDGLLTLLLNQVQESLNRPLGLFVVADGMGGHAAGQVATRLTLDAVRAKAVADLLTPTGPRTRLAYDQWLIDATAAANTAVHEHRRSAGNDMGNTLVMALVVGDTAYVSNVGDSRAYMVNQREIRQFTTDHSLVERLIALGKITPQEARTHPQRNVIYRTIGDRASVETDVFTQRLSVGDYLLLCSDGLSGMITDQDIFNIVRSAVSPQDACDRLVEAANAAGGDDNITVIIVQALT